MGATVKHFGRAVAALLVASGSASVAAQESPGMSAMNGMSGAEEMLGLYGPYSMTREGSGSSWQPDSTPLDGLMSVSGPWMGMVHGLVNAIYDDQGGPRG